jgi:hypothetical protein
MMRKIILIAGISAVLFVVQFLTIDVFSQGSKVPVLQVPVINAAPIGKSINPDGSKSGFKRFPVYTDKNSPDNHYVPSGWMGDYGDMRLTDRWTQNPHGGTTCIQWKYVPKGSQGANWAGSFWQNPANNWGAKKGGYNLTGAKKLVFWARGEKGGERLAEVGVGGIEGEYADSDKVSIGPIDLTKEWKKFEIDLTGADISYISGGFYWSASGDDVPEEGITFYLDDIAFE